MVNVLHTTPTKPIADEQAMEEFRHQWHVYSKLVDHDCFSHREVAATLRRRWKHAAVPTAGGPGDDLNDVRVVIG